MQKLSLIAPDFKTQEIPKQNGTKMVNSKYLQKNHFQSIKTPIAEILFTHLVSQVRRFVSTVVISAKIDGQRVPIAKQDFSAQDWITGEPVTMSSLEQLPKSDNRQNAEFEIERGSTKIKARIPERPFIICVLLAAIAVLAYCLGLWGWATRPKQFC